MHVIYSFVRVIVLLWYKVILPHVVFFPYNTTSIMCKSLAWLISYLLTYLTTVTYWLGCGPWPLTVTLVSLSIPDQCQWHLIWISNLSYQHQPWVYFTKFSRSPSNYTVFCSSLRQLLVQPDSAHKISHSFVNPWVLTLLTTSETVHDLAKLNKVTKFTVFPLSNILHDCKKTNWRNLWNVMLCPKPLASRWQYT